MQYPGEYVHAAQRKTHVDEIFVATKTSVRLKAAEPLRQEANVDQQEVFVTAENDSETNDITLQLLETNDIAVAASRDNLGSAVTIKPQGKVQFTVFPQKRYLEIKSNAGNGRCRLQLTSQIRWDKLAFSKTDTVYPQSILNPQTLPAINNT